MSYGTDLADTHRQVGAYTGHDAVRHRLVDLMQEIAVKRALKAARMIQCLAGGAITSVPPMGMSATNTLAADNR